MSTPGITGRVGKCPGKYGSFADTFLSARMRLPGSHSSTRSIIRNGKRCGRSASTLWMSSSAMAAPFFPSLDPLLALQLLLERAHAVGELGEVAHERGIARP